MPERSPQDRAEGDAQLARVDANSNRRRRVLQRLKRRDNDFPSDTGTRANSRVDRGSRQACGGEGHELPLAMGSCLRGLGISSPSHKAGS
jgi:hypothetical protein